MTGNWVCNRDVVAFTAMAVLESSTVVLLILYKAATLKGLKFFVYVTYSHAFGALILLPLSFIFSRDRGVPNCFKLPRVFLYRVILLSLVSFLARVSGFKGIEYSSPALASSISTLTPAFTFILAVIFRMENFNLRSSSTQAKIIGTVVSVAGALVMVLYKGPTILSSSSTKVASQYRWPSLRLSPSNWVVGGLLIVFEMLLNSGVYILQTQLMKIYPDGLVVAMIKCFLVTLIALPVSFVAERDLSVWRLRIDITLIAVLYAVLFGPAFIATIQCFCAHLKGPFYIAIFVPFAIVISTAGSFIFLGDVISLGSVIGAIILLIGFYAVLSGKAKEERSVSNFNVESNSANGRTPLLQS